MKVSNHWRVLEFIVVVLLAYCMFATVSASAAVKDKLDTNDPTFAKITSLSYIDNGKKVSLGNSFLDIKCSDGETLYNKGYRVMQGGCMDTAGNNLYYLILNDYAKSDPDKQKPDFGKTALVKVNTNDWTVSVLKTGLSLGHANDMTYYNGKLVVTHYRNSSKNQVRTMSMINLSNLNDITLFKNSQVKVKDSAVGIFGIAYNKSKNEFVIGISDSGKKVKRIAHLKFDGTNFTESDAGFKFSKDASVSKVLESHYLQGLECSSNGIYIVCSPRQLEINNSNKYNRIITYGWTGNLNKITLLASTLEGENISRVYGTTNFYVGYCAPSKMTTVERTGTRIHTFKLTK